MMTKIGTPKKIKVPFCKQCQIVVDAINVNQGLCVPCFIKKWNNGMKVTHELWVYDDCLRDLVFKRSYTNMTEACDDAEKIVEKLLSSGNYEEIEDRSEYGEWIDTDGEVVIKVKNV